MKIKTFVFNPFSENTYVIIDEKTSACAIIDPGCFYPEENKKLISYLTANNLVPDKILLTHCHLDHVFGTRCLLEEYPSIKTYAHRNEQFFIDNAIEQGHMFGVEMQQPSDISNYITDNETIHVGEIVFNVISTPGHSPGGVGFYCKQENVLFCGDTLFACSIGRSDLYGGNEDILIDSIKNRLFSLPDNTIVYSGHGQTTTIGNEKSSNPYI